MKVLIDPFQSWLECARGAARREDLAWLEEFKLVWIAQLVGKQTKEGKKAESRASVVCCAVDLRQKCPVVQRAAEMKC